jgi:hypothetical protein
MTTMTSTHIVFGRSLVMGIDRLSTLALSRFAYWATVALAASIFWLSPRLPMVDLPQHVAQVTLWHDLITDQSPWADLFTINLFTPYLTTYTLALCLSFLMSTSIAFKLLLTAALIGFVASCVQIRKNFDADARFDWLYIVSFFGFAYEYGFVTFLISTPICLQFIKLAHRQTQVNNCKLDVGIIALGLTLLVSHGLSFLFAGLVSGCMLLATAKSPKIFFRRAIPYVILALACFAFVWAGRDALAAPLNSTVYWHDPITKLRSFAINLQGSYNQELVPVTLCMLAAIWLMRPKFSLHAAVPFCVIISVYILAPNAGYSTALLYQRFAIFVLPLLAFAFAKPTANVNTTEMRASLAVLMLCCWATVAVNATRVYTFGVESADFETVLNAAEPGRRALSHIIDNTSPAANNPMVYLNHASWYQVEKRGLVEFNFAYHHPMIVRYKPSSIPNKGFGFDPEMPPFDWSLPQSRTADYYFIRQEGQHLPADFINNPACTLKLVNRTGAWSLFERGACKAN